MKSLINANDDLTVVAEAGSVQEAIDQALRTKPDVVVMDVRLADGSGIEATREIRARLEKTQVLMLTSFADDEALFASIMAGAAGYVLKQIRGGELVRAIRDRGTSIVFVEHLMRAVVALSDRVAVLNEGALIAIGTPQETMRDAQVISVYLGTPHAA